MDVCTCIYIYLWGYVTGADQQEDDTDDEDVFIFHLKYMYI